MKNFRKSSLAMHVRSQGVPNVFRAPIHWAHHAVVFKIERLSCFFCYRSYFELLDYWRAEKFLYFRRPPLRPEARGICHICHMVNPALAIIMSGTGIATDFKFGQCIHRVHPNKRPIKFFEKTERGTAQIFKVPPIISGTGKARNFKFGRYIHMVHPNKSPLKIFEKVERGRIQELPKFFVYPLLSRKRKKLRISNLASTFTGSIRTKAH